MMNSKKILLFIPFIFAMGFSVAQQQKDNPHQNKYSAVNWRVDDGLAHDQTLCMLKDVSGFLWVGTKDGLSRFDGSTFKNYFYDPQKKNTIAGPMIQGLVEDSLHNIWIGTDKGLSRYDIKADTFTNFFPGFPSTTFSTFIIPFWATKDEIYCHETDSLLVSYNVHSLKKTILNHLGAEDSLQVGPYAKQYSIFDASSNSIWLLTRMFHGELLNISLSTGERKTYNLPGFAEEMRLDHSRNSIWINTEGGLIEFSLRDKQAHHIGALKELEKKSNDHIGIDLDPSGRVWFFTSPSGIFIYDPKDESFHPVFENDTVLQKRISEANGCIYCDRDGIVWSGFWLRKGIYQLVPFSQVVISYNANVSSTAGLHTNDILNIVKGEGSEMWMGTSDGLYLYDTNKETFRTLREKDLPGLKGKRIMPIFVNTVLKKAWLQAEEPLSNIYEMDLASRKCKTVVFRDSLNQTISPELTDGIPIHYKNGCIITGTYNKQHYIFLVNSDSAVAKQIISLPKGTTDFNLTQPFVTNHLLFITRPNALGNLTYSDNGSKWIKVHSPMDSISWSIIVQDKTDLSYWVVVPRQLIHYDHDFRLLKQYTTLEDGLPHDKIYGLIPDNKRNIWFNTNRSIYQLNVKTGQINNLSEKDGFTHSDFRDMGEGIAKDNDGDLYFTTAGFVDGFKRIRPEKFVSRQSYVYVKSIAIKEFSLPASTGVNNVEQLSLKYFQNSVNIKTGVIDYYSQGKSQIRYKLEGEGQNASWQYGPANYSISYEALPPGKYKLLIQASNAGNEFIGPLKTLVFQISPAFWNTWWFRIIALVFIAAISFGLMRWRLKQKFNLQLERSEKETQLAEMRQNTAELKQQSAELEMQALRAQMNPHFIFNSLNSINRFILQNDRLQASEYLTKFSKLVRMILQNSQASLITLESELDALGLYLEMEALRFNYHFTYKISVPKDLDIEVLKVPPLIIQPYVENAIWHGLMHKEEKGQLDIEISEEGDHLYFKVTDNGIGRKRASELASKSATKHKSMGLKITAHRIAMMQHSGDEVSPVTINDLVEPDGTAAGTEVIIKMPVLE